MKIGPRTLLAATCMTCGVLAQGVEFKRHKRNKRDKRPYLDLRCRKCKWRIMEARR